VVGDCRDVLSSLPDRVVQCCVTSPPYYGLRDNGDPRQIGLEDSIDAYVRAVVGVFAEVRRVLRDDGTLWVVIGDGYAAGGRYKRAPDRLNPLRAMAARPRTDEIRDKNILGIPWRVALALQADGWDLRTEIVWAKTCAMPESVRDRPTRSHEYIFLLAKNRRYRYDRHAAPGPGGQPLRTVWPIAARGSPGGSRLVHAFPDTLVARCLSLSTRPGDFVLDPFAG